MAARDDDTADTPSIREIADLTRRLRALSNAGRDVDPTERAAFLVDNDALIGRIEATTRRGGTATRTPAGTPGRAADDVWPDTAAWTAEPPGDELAALGDDGEEWSR